QPRQTVRYQYRFQADPRLDREISNDAHLSGYHVPASHPLPGTKPGRIADGRREGARPSDAMVYRLYAERKGQQPAADGGCGEPAEQFLGHRTVLHRWRYPRFW